MKKSVLVTLTCGSCGCDFKYLKKSNVVKLFCEVCAKTRNAEAKRRYQKTKLKNFTETKQQLKQELDAIPDHVVDASRLIDEVIKGL